MKSRKKPIHPYLKTIGENIKALRVKRKLSLEALGASIGIDGSNMQKIEKGSNITLSSLIKIFIVLETTPAQFFSEISWKLSEEDIESFTIPRAISKRKKSK